MTAQSGPVLPSHFMPLALILPGGINDTCACVSGEERGVRNSRPSETFKVHLRYWCCLPKTPCDGLLGDVR